MPSLYTYKVFISHAWSYSSGYEGMISLLNDAPNFSYANYSIPQSKAFEGLTNAQLSVKLRDQMVFTNIAIILGGMYVAHSDWIQYEIDLALSMSKPILGVRPWGSERMPRAVSSAASQVVGWNTSSIVQAIRDISK